MRHVILVSALFSALSVSALAQEAPGYSQTLDEQKARLDQGKPAVPFQAMPASPAPASKLSPSAGREWPASASAPDESSADSHTVYRARDGEVIQSEGGGAIDAVPLPVMSNGTVRYITGGVGQEELDQLKSIENDFNVRVLIAEVKGEYIGGALVRVLNAKDETVLIAENAGPYFYAWLPEGSYMFEITNARGNMRAVKIKAPATAYTKTVVRF